MLPTLNSRWTKRAIFVLCIWLLWNFSHDFSVTTKFQQVLERAEENRQLWMQFANSTNTGNSSLSLLQDKHTEKEITQKKALWWEKLFCRGYRKDYSEEGKGKFIFSLKEFLVDVLPNEDESKNIFMLDNGCNASVAFRSLCAVESTARYNPKSTLFLLVLTKYFEGLTAEVVKKLVTKLPNVVPVTTNLDSLFKSTPFEKEASRINWTTNLDYLYPHLSDIMRFPLMWRFGGVYLDADTIAVRSLPEFKNTYVFVFPKAMVACGYIFTKKNHPVMLDTMRYVAGSYDGNDWGKQDSVALSEVLKLYCGSQTLEYGQCKDITFLPVEAMQPVNWAHIYTIFEANYTKDIKAEIGNAYGVHTNRHLTQDIKIELGKNSFFDILTKEHCPVTYYGMINRTDIK